MRVPVAFGPYKEPGPAWRSAYRCEWGEVVGRRVRVLRQNAGLRIYDLANDIRRADGRPYSASFVSRLERGWASAPLYVYCVLARRFEVAAGELLGTEGVERAVDDAELTMVRVVRRLGLTPEDAIARLAGGAPTPAGPR
jgi:transcriptional regulator with XRE-family HTH domain